eukprot:TRINITY_DN20504_c0_g3_i1.p1 TRINITY_DN20504_c0_g3~~TRINITY_DN20504_c0_g3_i1.p1  ORF type:complete len:218 (-),score=45.91 TRINITY_DN20504_c0_g3_i1:75-728(-)
MMFIDDSNFVYYSVSIFQHDLFPEYDDELEGENEMQRGQGEGSLNQEQIASVVDRVNHKMVQSGYTQIETRQMGIMIGVNFIVLVFVIVGITACWSAMVMFKWPLFMIPVVFFVANSILSVVLDKQKRDMFKGLSLFAQALGCASFEVKLTEVEGTDDKIRLVISSKQDPIMIGERESRTSSSTYGSFSIPPAFDEESRMPACWHIPPASFFGDEAA